MTEKDATVTTKDDNDLAPGDVVSGLEASELVEIQRIAPLGTKTLIEGVGLQSRRIVKRPLAAEELAALVKVRGQQPAFDGDAKLFLLGAEAERIRIAHQFDPLFAVNSSIVDPLPHQVEAVYRYLLPLPRIRFLLADDTGAGKTIMTGGPGGEKRFIEVKGRVQSCAIFLTGPEVEQAAPTRRASRAVYRHLLSGGRPPA